MAGKPIRIEFMIEKDRMKADFTSLIDAMAGKFKGDMTSAATSVVKAIESVENAINRLNKPAGFDFGAGFKELNDNLGKIVDTLTNGVQKSLNTMKVRLRDIRAEARGLREDMASIKTGDASAGSAGSGAAKTLTIDPSVREGLALLGKLRLKGAGSDTGGTTYAFGPGGTKEISEHARSGIRATITRRPDENGKMIETAIRITNENVNEIAKVNDAIDKMIASDGWKKLRKKQFVRFSDSGAKIYQQQFIDEEGGRTAIRTTASDSSIADFRATLSKYTGKGITSKAKLDDFIRDQLGAAAGMATPISGEYTTKIDGAGLQRAQKFMSDTGQVVTWLKTLGEARFEPMPGVKLSGAGGNLKGVLPEVLRRLAGKGFDVTAPIGESFKTIDKDVEKTVTTYKDAAGNLAKVVHDASGNARATFEKARTTTSEITKNDTDIRVALGERLSNGQLRFSPVAGSEESFAGGRIQRTTYQDQEGVLLKVTQDLMKNIFTKAQLVTPEKTKSQMEMEQANRYLTNESKLLADGFSATTKTMQRERGGVEEIIRTFKKADGSLAHLNETTGEVTIAMNEDRTAIIAAANARNVSKVQGAGMRLMNTRTSVDADGKTIVQQDYANARTGATAVLNATEGTLSESLPNRSKWQQLVANAKWAWDNIGKGVSPVMSLLSGVTTTVSKIGVAFVRLAGIVYVVKNAWTAVDNFLVSPVKRFITSLVEATEQYREFETAISGVTGGMQRARMVNDAAVDAWKDLPIRLKDVQDIARQMAFIAPLSSKIATGSQKTISNEITDFSKLVSKLSLLDPEQGPAGVLVALREAIAGGEFRSLRFRLEISPQQIARTIGKDLSELIGNPELTQKALQKFADLYIGDEAVQRMGELFSVRMGKLYDTIRHGLAKIGDQGIFDTVVKRAGDGAKALFDFIDSPKFAAYGERISRAMEGIFNNSLKAVDHIIRRITGATNEETTIEAIVDRLTEFFEWLSDQSKGLPAFFDKLYNVFDTISEVISGLITGIGMLAKAAYWLLPSDQRNANPEEREKAASKFIAERLGGSAQYTLDYVNTATDAGGSTTILHNYDGGISIPGLGLDKGDAIWKLLYNTEMVKDISGTYRVADPAGMLEAIRAMGWAGSAGARPIKGLAPMTADSIWGSLYGSALPYGKTWSAAYKASPEYNLRQQALSLNYGFNYLGDFNQEENSPLAKFIAKTGSALATKSGASDKVGIEGVLEGMQRSLKGASGAQLYQGMAIKDEVVNQLQDAARQFGMGLVELTKDLPAPVRLAFIEQVNSGRNIIGDSLAKALKIPAEWVAENVGTDKMALTARLNIRGQQMDAIRDLQGMRGRLGNWESGGFGEIDGGFSGEAVSSREAGMEALSRYKGMFPGVFKDYEDAFNARKKATGANAILAERTLGDAGYKLAELIARIRELSQELDPAQKAMKAFVDAFDSDVSNKFTDAVSRFQTMNGNPLDRIARNNPEMLSLARLALADKETEIILSRLQDAKKLGNFMDVGNADKVLNSIPDRVISETEYAQQMIEALSERMRTYQKIEAMAREDLGKSLLGPAANATLEMATRKVAEFASQIANLRLETDQTKKTLVSLSDTLKGDAQSMMTSGMSRMMLEGDDRALGLVPPEYRDMAALSLRFRRNERAEELVKNQTRFGRNYMGGDLDEVLANIASSFPGEAQSAYGNNRDLLSLKTGQLAKLREEYEATMQAMAEDPDNEKFQIMARETRDKILELAASIRELSHALDPLSQAWKAINDQIDTDAQSGLQEIIRSMAVQDGSMEGVISKRLAGTGLEGIAKIRMLAEQTGILADNIEKFGARDLSDPQGVVDRILGAPYGVANGISPKEKARQQLALYQRQLQQFTDQYNAAVDRNHDNPNPLDAATIQAASAQMADMAVKIKQVSDALDDAGKNAMEFFSAVEQAMEQGLGDAIYNIITGTGKMRDVLVGFARDVARAFSQMTAKNLMNALMGGESSSSGGIGLGGIIMGALGLGEKSSNGWQGAGSSATSTGGGVNFGGGMDFAANGAVWQGGFTPLRAFANGGVVDRPMIGLIGEGQYNEAVVPLPNGREIPVDMRGAGGGGGNVYVVYSPEEAFRMGMKPNKDTLINLVAGDVKKGGKIGKSVRRTS